jgi:hypothetical protein
LRAAGPLWVMSRHRVSVRVMSVISLRAEIHQSGLHVRFVPLADSQFTPAVGRSRR